MSLTTLKDFSDIMVPILEDGTYTNYGKTPKIITIRKKSSRGNINTRIEVRNLSSSPLELAFDGTVILQNLNGRIDVIHTDNTKRNALKADLVNILKAVPFSISGIDDNPKIRNKETSQFFLQIID